MVSFRTCNLCTEQYSVTDDDHETHSQSFCSEDCEQLVRKMADQDSGSEHHRMHAARLKIDNWQGISIGATHFYGSIRWNLDMHSTDSIDVNRLMSRLDVIQENKKQRYQYAEGYRTVYYEGQETMSFNSDYQLMEAAIDAWHSACPDTVYVLLEGDSSACEPQRLLDCRNTVVLEKWQDKIEYLVNASQKIWKESEDEFQLTEEGYKQQDALYTNWVAIINEVIALHQESAIAG